MKRLLAACAVIAVIAGCSGSSSSPANPTVTRTATATATSRGTTTAAPVPRSPRTIVTGLQVPWGLVFLPDGSALVNERTTGRIMRIPKGGGTPHLAMQVHGVNTDSEGGLLG